MIVAPQAFKNGIEVLTPIVIAHAKDHSDVDQMLTRNQIMPGDVFTNGNHNLP